MDVVNNDEDFGQFLNMKVTGNCGNLTLEKNVGTSNRIYHEVLDVELGTCEKLKEAMTISGNHNLDLQLVIIAFDTWDSVWINPV